MATVLELASMVDAEGKPLIRTTDGRTLRQECDWGFCAEGVFVYQGREVGECPKCQGRGWLPVGEDEAVVVCLEWLCDGRVGAVNIGKRHDWYVDDFRIMGRHRGAAFPAAVFEAAKQIAGGEQ